MSTYENKAEFCNLIVIFMLYCRCMLTQIDLTKLNIIFATKSELQSLDQKLDQKFDRVMNMLDAVMAELKAIREEQAIMFHHLIDHEERIKVI